MGEMMAGMGGMGGFASMMGGGGGGGEGNMGMMGGLASMMGGGGIGAGSGMSASIAQNMVRRHVTDAVQYIVGPDAKPDQAIIAFATRQGRVPSTMFQMLPYLPYFQKIALATYGGWLEAEAAAGNTTYSGNGTNTGSAAGTTDQATKDKNFAALKKGLEATVMRRAIEYMNRPQTQQAAAGGNMMAVIGQMIPNMIRGIQAQYM